MHETHRQFIATWKAAGWRATYGEYTGIWAGWHTDGRFVRAHSMAALAAAMA